MLGHEGVDSLLDHAVKTAAQVAVEMQVARLVFTDRLSIAVKRHEVDELEVLGWHSSWRELFGALNREVDVLELEAVLALTAHDLALLGRAKLGPRACDGVLGRDAADSNAFVLADVLRHLWQI